MTITKNYAIAILDNEKNKEINNIISKYGSITLKSSSHIHFDTQPINPNEITQDITYFKLDCEDESILDKTLTDLIESLNQENTYYSLRDESSGKLIVAVPFVYALDIKFDNIKIIKEGTYKKIDELKVLKTEYGICKGYRPNFRPVESNPIGNITIKTESIYLFCKTEENLEKLKNLLSEKITEIDPELTIGFRPFYASNN